MDYSYDAPFADAFCVTAISIFTIIITFPPARCPLTAFITVLIEPVSNRELLLSFQ